MIRIAGSTLDSIKDQNTYPGQMLLGSNNGWSPSNKEPSVTLESNAPSINTEFKAISLPENSVPENLALAFFIDNGTWVSVMQDTAENECLYHALEGVAEC